MHNQDIKFESQGAFKVIQQVWLGLIVIVAISLAVSSFVMNQQDFLFNLLTLCLVGMLFHMGHMSFLCCRHLNTRLRIKNGIFYHDNGSQETQYPLNEVSCDEFPIANVYKITNSQDQVIAYINGLLPNSKKLATQIKKSEKM